MADLKVNFVPTRWWEALNFLRLNFEMVRGCDPLADSILAQPWSPSNLLECGYMLDNFFHTDNYFILADNHQAGLVSLGYRPEFIFIYSLGLLPDFQRQRVGKQAAEFIEAYRKQRGCPWAVAAMAVGNRPVQLLSKAFGGRPLGISTTTLTLTGTCPSISSLAKFKVKRLTRAEANEAWKQWRLHEVEQIAGPDVVDIAASLLETPPRGEYLAIYRRRHEVGFAVAQKQGNESEASVFISRAFWSDVPTADLVALIENHLGTTVRHLTLTETHANTLNGSTFLRFERPRKQERHLVVFKQF